MASLIEDNAVRWKIRQGGLLEYQRVSTLDILNIALIGITDDLPQHDKKYELHRLITTLFSDKLEANQKYDILEKEYDILLNDDLKKEANVMCNLGQGIEKRATKIATKIATEKTNEKVILNM